MNEQRNIHELISNYFSGEASPEEAMWIEDWKDKNEENRLYFEQCEKILSSPVYKADIEKSWQKVKSQVTIQGKIKSTQPWSHYLRIAASVALFIGLGTAMMYWFNKSRHKVTEYVTNGETKHVVLSDGSDVTIAANSSLTAEEGFGEKKRKLHLKGSAYFSVVHNEKIPFVIDAGGVFIKDIGTRFFIHTSSDTDTVHVHVDEGVVLLFDDKGANVEIKAGGNSLYVKSTRQIVSNAPQTARPIAFTFSNTTLAEVVERLNEAYTTHVKIANPALNNCTLTTQFNNEKLETILSVIAETLGLTYEKTGDGYVIKGENCHP